MRKRLFYGIGIVLLVLSVVLVVWQGSFSMKDFPPSNPSQTLIFWAMSTLIFILMVTVGWILVREFVKLYVARQANRLDRMDPLVAQAPGTRPWRRAGRSASRRARDRW